MKNKTRVFAITTSTQHYTGGSCLCSKVGKKKEEKKGIGIEREETNLVLLVVFIANPPK